MDSNLIALKGVSAGNYSDGFPAYIGRGDNSAYLGMSNCTARISVNPAKSGAFMTNAAGEIFDASSAYFLINHADLLWTNVTASTAFFHPNSMKWMAGKFPMLIGRFNVSGYTVVGRVRNYQRHLIPRFKP